MHSWVILFLLCCCRNNRGLSCDNCCQRERTCGERERTCGERERRDCDCERTTEETCMTPPPRKDYPSYSTKKSDDCECKKD